MTNRWITRRELADAAQDYDYLAVNTGIALAGKRYLTQDGMLFILSGEVALARTGDGSPVDRLIAAAPVAEVEVLSKPWWGLGVSMIMKIDDETYRVEPESLAQGSGLATPRKYRRARAAVHAFEQALEAAKRASPSDDIEC